MSNGVPESPCSCGNVSDPQVVSNPPGLSQISYQVDDFTGFRRAMLRPLPGEQAIGAWRPAQGDLGLQVIEWWAYLAQIIQFYNERHANESYLRTATRQASLANLVALLGYQPAPGVAATGNVAVTRTTSHPAEPLAIPAGMKLASVATPGLPSQTFETGPAVSFPGPSSVPVTIPPSTAFVANADGSQSLLLAGSAKGVKPGDELLLVAKDFAGTDDSWSLITVTAVAPQTDPNTGVINTLVTFTGGWGPTPAPSPPTEIFIEERPTFDVVAHSFELDQSTEFASSTASESEAEVDRSVFGVGSYHWRPGRYQPQPSGPPPPQTTDYRLLRPLAATSLWNQATDNSSQVVIGAGGTPVQLSATVRGISPGDMVLFDGGTGSPSALAIVSGVSDELWTVLYPGNPKPKPAEIVIAHSALSLTMATPDSYVLVELADTSTVAVRYSWRDVGTIIAIPAVSLPSLPVTLNVPQSYQPPPAAATAFLVDATGTGVLVTFSAAGAGQITVNGAGTPAATITTALAVPLQLLLDVVPVSRGTTVTGEVVGSGNAALINQSFTLQKGPLTYLQAGNDSVAALVVYVDGVLWQQVPSMYDQPPDAHVYVVTRSADQSVTTLTFGDGVNGARLTSGSGNVMATYRYGSGLSSPLAGRLTTISQPQANLASIQNPVAVGGGADPQSPDDVRANAPASVFTFGRAISAVDYEVVARQAPGVARATAYWTFDGAQQRTLVTVYVGDDDAAVTAATSALAGSDDPNRPVSVLAATPVELGLSCTLVVSADRQATDVVAAATAAVADTGDGLFSPSGMGIGQRLYRSAVDAALSVPGVVAVHDLAVTRPIVGFGFGFGFGFHLELPLDEIFDPGEGAFFDLPPGNVSIGWVSAGG
jgi:hypothetical protein